MRAAACTRCAPAPIWSSFTDNWFAGVNAGFTHLTGDAASSPISVADNYATALSFVGYRF